MAALGAAAGTSGQVFWLAGELPGWEAGPNNTYFPRLPIHRDPDQTGLTAMDSGLTRRVRSR